MYLDNVEITRCGQLADTTTSSSSASTSSSSWRARSCVHVVADVELIGSALQSCAVHTALGSGVTLQAARRISIASTAVFDVVGHGIALRGGRARFNSITSNIVSGTRRAATGDQFPACFYAAHPTNDLSGNVAAGCEFAGYWFDLAAHVAGNEVCPQRAPLGRFLRNTARANGRYGLWIPRHFSPAVECGDPSVMGTRRSSIAQFQAFANGHTGMYLGVVGDYDITGSTFLDSGASGLAIDTIEIGTVNIRTSYFMAQSTSVTVTPADKSRGVYAISAPGSEGTAIANCSFIGYNDDTFAISTNVGGTTIRTVVPTFALRTCARCDEDGYRELGGFTYMVEGLQFLQSPNRVFYGPPHQDIVLDLDGSLVGRATGTNYTAVPRRQHIVDLPGCLEPPVLAIILYAGPGTSVFICGGSYRFHRLLVSNPSPSLLSLDNLTIDSSFGATSSSYRVSTRYPERSGFLFVVPSGTARDELGTALYDVNALNFTIYNRANNDWSKITTYVSTMQAFANRILKVRFGYVADVARIDAVRLRFSPLNGSVFPVQRADTVIPTVYADPAAIEAAGGTPSGTHMYLEADLRRATVWFAGGGLQALEMTRVLCARTGCIKVEPPVIPARSYTWSDPRAWRSGVIPVDGDDAVIPPGMTVTLSGDTAQLRSLVIQGTLEFHPRLASTLYAAYVIVFGGALRSQTAHSPLLQITLRSDANGTAPFGVEEGRVLRPGTMLVMGQISLTGTARTQQWTTLSDSFKTAAQGELKVQDTVTDWVRGDVLVVSTASRNGSRYDEAIVGELANSGRTIRVVNALTFDHDANVVDFATGQRLTLRSKVGLLTRNIVIDGGSPRRGHRVIFAEYGRDVAFAARGTIDSTEIRYGGFANDTNVLTAAAAVSFEGLMRHAVAISRSSIHDSFTSAIRISGGAVGVTVSDSVIYRTIGSGVDAGDGNGNIFLRNLAVGIHFPKAILDRPSTPYALCAYDSRFGINTFDGNVAAGSASEGFCLQLPSCDQTTIYVANNEAHSGTIGFFITEVTAPEAAIDDATATARRLNPQLATMRAVSRRCVSMSTPVAWQNSYMGVYSHANADVQISGALIHDNHIGVHLGHAGNYISTLTSSVVAGRSKPLNSLACSEFRCRMDTITNSCPERYEVLRDAPSFIEGEIGLQLSTYTANARVVNYSRAWGVDLPLTRPRMIEPPSEDSAVYIQNVLFANFLFGTELGLCSGAKAIATEGFSLNTVTPHFFSNISYSDVNFDLGVMYLHSPSNSWSGPSMCKGHTCDALQHVALRDEDGSLTQSNGGTTGTTSTTSSRAFGGSVYSNYADGALVACTYVKEWNAYHCPRGSYAQLRASNLDDDNRTRSVSPLEFQDELFLARINTALQPPACHRSECNDLDLPRPGTITLDIRTERVYLVDFGTDVPRRSRWELRNCLTDTALPRSVVLRLLMSSRRDVNVWANGRYIPPSPTSVSFMSEVGANYFESNDNRQYLVLHCGSVVEAHQLVNAVVTMRVGMVIEQFVATISNVFVSRMAAFLQLPESQIDVLEVYPGSTVIRFRVLAADSADYNPSDEANLVNARVLRLLTTSRELLSAELEMPVVSIDAVEWAEPVAGRGPIPGYSVGYSTEFIVAISVSSVAAFLLLIVGIKRMHSSILNYRDRAEEIGGAHDEHELQALAAHDEANLIDLPHEDRAAPRVEVGMKSMRITVDVEQDDVSDDDGAGAIVGGGRRGFGGASPPAMTSAAANKYWSAADDD